MVARISNTANDALPVPVVDVAGLGAPLLVNLAIVLLRVSAIAGLASPLLIIWLVS